MKLGMLVGLGPGHIVLVGDPAPPPPKGHSPQFLAHICCGKMAEWVKMPCGMELGLGLRDCIRWGPFPLPKKGAELPPKKKFGPCLLWPNGWMHQDATWYGGRPQPGDFVLDGDPARPPMFSAHVYYCYCDFVRTSHSRYWFVQVHVLVFYAFYFRKKV